MNSVSPAHLRMRIHSFIHPFTHLSECPRSKLPAKHWRYNGALKKQERKAIGGMFPTTQIIQIMDNALQLGFLGLVHQVSGVVISTSQASPPLIPPVALYLGPYKGEAGKEAQEGGATCPSHTADTLTVGTLDKGFTVA